MTIRQFNTSGTIAKARPQRSYTTALTGNAQVDTALKSVADRLFLLESVVGDPVTTVEVTIAVTATNTYTITHNLNSPVRWYVVDWLGSSNAASFTRTSGTSTLNSLVLLANTTGTATIRIESSYGAMP